MGSAETADSKPTRGEMKVPRLRNGNVYVELPWPEIFSALSRFSIWATLRLLGNIIRRHAGIRCFGGEGLLILLESTKIAEKSRSSEGGRLWRSLRRAAYHLYRITAFSAQLYRFPPRWCQKRSTWCSPLCVLECLPVALLVHHA